MWIQCIAQGKVKPISLDTTFPKLLYLYNSK